MSQHDPFTIWLNNEHPLQKEIDRAREWLLWNGHRVTLIIGNGFCPDIIEMPKAQAHYHPGGLNQICVHDGCLKRGIWNGDRPGPILLHELAHHLTPRWMTLDYITDGHGPYWMFACWRLMKKHGYDNRLNPFKWERYGLDMEIDMVLMKRKLVVQS